MFNKNQFLKNERLNLIHFLSYLINYFIKIFNKRSRNIYLTFFFTNLKFKILNDILNETFRRFNKEYFCTFIHLTNTFLDV